jgi:hypothetical protein
VAAVALAVAVGVVATTVDAGRGGRIESESPVSPIRADFNADGRMDLVVGLPSWGPSGANDVGAVQILLGTKNGPTTVGARTFRQGADGVPGRPNSGDRFGDALAVGDFNGDGWTDLAVGVPGESGGRDVQMGAVTVLYGTPTGLETNNVELFQQGTGGLGDVAEHLDRFGETLAAGDFNGDGTTDLAIGSPEEGVGDVANAGLVHVLYGSATGLNGAGSRMVQQGSDGVPDVPEFRDHFGNSLEAGDFNGDGVSDLAVGAYGQRIGGVPAGAVTAIYGTANGLSGTGSQLLRQGVNGLVDGPEEGDGFGTVLASGDFDGDGRADLVVAAPFEDVGSFVDSGAVQMLLGGPTGLAGTGSGMFRQGAAGISDRLEASDRFGEALAAGDFDGDGRTDLAIGTGHQAIATVPNCGMVHILRGGNSGLTATGSRTYYQGFAGIGDAPENGDNFGLALAAGDLNGDGRTDLAIGVPNEDLPGLLNVGMVHVVSPRWLDLDHQTLTPGGGFDPTANEGFGSVIAVG